MASLASGDVRSKRFELTRKGSPLVPAMASPGYRNLVLGTAIGLAKKDVGIFLESFRSHNREDDVVLLVSRISQETEDYLRRQSVKLLPFRPLKYLHGHVNSCRMIGYLNFLETHSAYREVLLSDVRDVLFQGNPFGICDPSLCHAFLERSGKTIGDDRINRKWVRRFIPADIGPKLALQPISCAGVTIGGRDAMLQYLTALTGLLRKVGIFKRRWAGADQIWHNYLLHLSDKVPMVAHSNNGLVATMALEGRDAYGIVDGCVVHDTGARPIVCHQYDRFPAIADFAMRQYCGEPVNTLARSLS